MVRLPVVAGAFYDSDFQLLEQEIIGSFNHRLGPGALPTKRKDAQIRGVIVPHAGYAYSGACAAWAYKEIAESAFPKRYILLGPSHQGAGSGISIEDWKTPFGVVRCDKAFAVRLRDKTSLEINESPHLNEHSIEVQLPFLQYVSKDNLSQLRVVPVAIDRDTDYAALAHEFAGVCDDSVFIISSDFTHYGRSYRYLPFTTDIPERISRLDSQAVDLIKALDIAGFSDFLNKTGDTICGYFPILVLMSYLLEKGSMHGKLLMHYLSGDLSGDYANSVSYASIIFR